MPYNYPLDLKKAKPRRVLTEAQREATTRLTVLRREREEQPVPLGIVNEFEVLDAYGDRSRWDLFHCEWDILKDDLDPVDPLYAPALYDEVEDFEEAIPPRPTFKVSEYGEDIDLLAMADCVRRDPAYYVDPVEVPKDRTPVRVVGSHGECQGCGEMFMLTSRGDVNAHTCVPVVEKNKDLRVCWTHLISGPSGVPMRYIEPEECERADDTCAPYVPRTGRGVQLGAKRVECPDCHKIFTTTKYGRLRQHPCTPPPPPSTRIEILLPRADGKVQCPDCLKWYVQRRDLTLTPHRCVPIDART